MAKEEPTAEALFAVYADVGMLLCKLQTFKYALAELVADEVPLDERVPPQKMFYGDWENLVSEFCSVFSAPDEVTDVVRTIPSLVNYLANHCFFDNVKVMATDAGCKQVRDELRQYSEGIIVYSAFLKDIANLASQGEAINWESLKRAHDWRRFTETLEPPPSGFDY